MKPTFTLYHSEESKVFFTSDTHYSHKNIVAGESDWVQERGSIDRCRDFETRLQMNQVLVNNINKYVRTQDILVHLGDWSFGGFDQIEDFRRRLNVERIYLILGNHDHHIENKKDGIDRLFQWTGHYARILVKQANVKYNFVACHYPIASWDMLSKGVYHIHGHLHLPQDRKVGEGRMLDVGMDGNNLEPYSLEQVVSLIQDRPKVSMYTQDHHNG